MARGGENLGAGNEPRGALSLDQPALGLQMRAQRAAADLAEALSLNQPPQSPGAAGAPMGAPGHPIGPAQAPPPMPPQGALGAPGAPMPSQRPGMSPLQMMPSMHSPPMEAVLQGPQGAQGAVKPVGFARGGLAVFKGR